MKKKYKVTVPNKRFNGERYGVQFKDGEAVGEFTPRQLKDMALKGYSFEEVKSAPKKTTRKAPAKKADK